MDWFKFHHGAVNDPKVQKLSPTMFKHWVNVLCLASANAPRGRVPAPGDVAFALRISEGKAQMMLDELMALELLDEDGDGNLVPHNWTGRQYEGGHDPVERSEAGSRGNHVRWHVKGKKPDPSCSLCVAEGIAKPIAIATVANRDTEQNRSRTDPDAEQTRPDPVLLVESKNIFRETERCLGRALTAAECDSLKDIEADFPEDTWRYALREASDLDKRSIRYIRRVCENQGKSDERKPMGRNGQAAPQAGVSAADALGIYGPAAEFDPDYWTRRRSDAEGETPVGSPEATARVAGQ